MNILKRETMMQNLKKCASTLEKIARRLLGQSIMIKYPGYNCIVCGKWIEEPFEIPEGLSGGEFFDTWNFCPECEKKLDTRAEELNFETE